MDAALGLQPAIGVGAGDLQRGGLDAGLLALAFFHQLYFIAVLFGPAHIHAHQHLRPVLRFGAAGTGVQLDIAIVAIGLTGQQAFDLAAFRFIGGGARGTGSLGQHLGVAVGLGHGDQFQRVGDLGLQLADAFHRRGDLVAFPHQLLRRGGVVPQRRVLGAVVQFGEAGFGDIPVKDASSAARRTA